MPTLLMVDMQVGMTWPGPAVRNNLGAEAVIGKLLADSRARHAPVFHVRHISRTPGSPFWPSQSGVEFQSALAPWPTEHVVEKNVPDAFILTGLVRWLHARGESAVVIVGVSTTNSVEATARTAGTPDAQRPGPLALERRLPLRLLASHPEPSMSIRSFEIISVPVSDPQRSKHFYLEVLGFELVRESPMGPGMTWIQLAPPGQSVTIALVTWFETMKPGGLQGVMVNTDDIDAEHGLLRSRGLVISEIQQEPWGRYAMFSDPDGNGWILRQPPEGA